jgi:predicted permease
MRRLLTFVEDGWFDSRTAIKTLARSPLYFIAAVLTLAVGVGANTAIASLVKATWLYSPPIRNLDRIVVFRRAPARLAGAQSRGAQPFATDLFRKSESETLSRQFTCFSGIAVELAAEGVASEFQPRPTLGDTGSEVRAKVVSSNYFGVLGVRVLGRGFVEQDDVPGGPPVVVVSHEFWRTRLGGDGPVVGRQILLGGTRTTVVGIADRAFRGAILGDDTDVWLPFGSYLQFVQIPSAATAIAPVRLFGRLIDGFSISDAENQVSKLDDRSTKLRPLRSAYYPVRSERQVQEDGRLLAVLAGTSTCVLLAACLNLATLMVVRSEQRRSDVAVRIALGIPLHRLFQLGMSEGAVVAMGGAGLALCASHVLLRALGSFTLPTGIDIALLHAGIDWSIVAFDTVTAVVATAACTLIGVMNLWRCRRDAGVRPGAPVRSSARLRLALLGLQVTFSITLVVGALLFVRTVHAALARDWGFSADRTLFLVVQPRLTQYPDDFGVSASDRRREDYVRLLERLRSAPGIAGVALGETPLSAGQAERPRMARAESGSTSPAALMQVGPGYLGVVGIRIRAGRDLIADDVRSIDRRSCVISETLAKALFGNQPAVGHVLDVSSDGSQSVATVVVGVSGDAVRSGFRTDATPAVYVATDLPSKDHWRPMLGLALRTNLPPERVMPEVRAQVLALFPDPVQLTLSTPGQDLRKQLKAERFAALLFSCFGASVFLLCVVGTYALSAYSLVQRRREFAVRLAVGATYGQVGRLVVAHSSPALTGGTLGGLILSMALSHFVEAYVFGLPAVDVPSYVAAVSAVVFASFTAGLAAARHVTRINPAAILASL